MGRLYEVTDRLKVPLFEKEKVESILEDISGPILSADKVAKKIGKGYVYPVTGHLAVLDSALTGDGRKRMLMAGY